MALSATVTRTRTLVVVSCRLLECLNQFIRTQFWDIVGDTLYGVYATFVEACVVAPDMILINNGPGYASSDFLLMMKSWTT